MNWRQAWVARNPEKAREAKRKNYAQTQGGPNSGKGWTDEEIRLVLEHSIPDRELSKRIGRSVQAIQIKRSRCS